MIKIAVLSDIHGNVQALEAILEDVNSDDVSHIIIAGDHICDGPEPNRVIDIIKNLSNSCIIKGNKEDYIISLKDGKNQHWRKYKQFASILWTYQNISEDNIKYIKSLDFNCVYKYDKLNPIRIVHGSLNRVNEIIDTNTKLVEQLNQMNENIYIYGHTHRTNYFKFGNKVAINPGSVGLPLYKNCLAEYGVLSIDYEKIEWNQKYVEYDREGYIQKMKQSGLYKASPIWSKAIIKSIMTGKNVSLNFLECAYNVMKKREIECEMIPDEIWDEIGNMYELA